MPGSVRNRRFQTFDIVVVVGMLVLASYGLGIIWSYVRVGSLAWLFVREAQFVLAVVAFVLWTVQNRSGGPIEEVDSESTFPLPPPSHRVYLYQSLTDDTDVSIDDAPSSDAYVFASGIALVGLSIGVELIHPMLIG